MELHNQELIACFFEEGFQLDFNYIQGKVPVGFDQKIENAWYQQYLENHDEMLFYFGFTDERKVMSGSLSFLYLVAATFIKSLSKMPDIELTRELTVLTPTQEELSLLLLNVPFVVGLEFITEQWIVGMYGRLLHVFASEIGAYVGTVSEFFQEHNAKINLVGRVFFHLVENQSNEHPFAFLATYSTGELKNKKSTHTPLKNALLQYKDQNEMLLKLLSTVSKAAQKSDFISEFVESGELFSPLRFTSREAYTFLKEIPLYEECGILCRMPDWWKKKSNSLKLSVKVGGKEPSKIGMDALLQFDTHLFYGEEQITENELRELLAQTSGLSLFKGKWIEVDHEKLQSTLDAFEKAKQLSRSGEYTLAEAMRLQLNSAAFLGINDEQVSVEVSNGEWLGGVLTRLTNPSHSETLEVSEYFKATLRVYQQKGFDWLNCMKNLGFGACLADDMGLGKTIQILALLEHMRMNHGGGRSLLIIPASLMGNWQREIEKFTPKLSYKLLYNKQENMDWEQMEDTNLFITTYGMAVRLQELRHVKWDLLILDEAQAIKNPGTKQTKAVKELKANAKIAMTGTPIENRLSDLWSLFDFLNAGLLGTSKEFTDFTKKLKEGKADYSKLRSVVNPFILRRLKTDKTIINDLPEKMEMKTYTTLTKKQVVLYNGLVKDLKTQLETAEGIARKGLVLASIMKFKQICNHPDQYLGQADFQDSHSGKFERLRDLCETIYEKRERVLVFTQFREMTQPISDFLETIFNHKGLILHGGTPVKKRPELVERFCGEEYVPFMVLSLKAGGVGLNLTAANHVIHFDRWWNPAVENQATDRAFRIGQQKNVMVYKLITMGTIEEKIDGMIEEKSKLAGELVASSGESWIKELDNQQLMELFTLVQAGEK